MKDSLSSIRDVELIHRPGPDSPCEGADWYRKFVQTIEGLRLLPAGWDSYEAEPPNEAAIGSAQRGLDILHRTGFAPQRVAPSVEGGVAIAWRRGRKNANIEFFNTGEILAATSDGSGHPRVWEITGEELEQALETLREYIEG